ncbi:Transcriptional regulator, ArsR family [hydrothermal vent metagenome]|uniref:Transcriptional regulator, ArsR family n=1 Tax=hydrothermal vent metagenome TaxID=652676 RepID=A0A3B1BR73_9ZZZZ
MPINTTEEIQQLSAVFKLLSEPNRLKILTSLNMECRPVSDIVKATGLSQTNVSFHLRLLREAGLVRPERKGAFIYYCLPDARLMEHVKNFHHWIEQKGKADTDKTT